MGSSRRSFLAGAAGAVGVGMSAGAANAAVENDTLGFKLGVASYSLREFQRGKAMRMIRELQTPYVSVKEFHLWINAGRQEWERGRRDFEKAGLQIMSGGNISFPTTDVADIRQKFEYAKTVGMATIVCAPTLETLPVVEKFVKEYNIAIAIHNHGPEDKHFPTPQSVLKAVKNMDPRCGLCVDVGHTTRTGTDIVASLAESGSRLLDVHIKDLRDLMKRGSDCDVGEGAMPIAAIFKQLRNMGYKGCVNLEYEIHGDDPLPGMQKSFSYMRGVLAGLKG
jgi:sugar phosphate isomerase/epimerase